MSPSEENQLLNDLFNAVHNYEVRDVLAKHGVTLAEAQAICGEHGHQWSTYETYTNMGLSMWSSRACEVCGVPYEPDDDDGY